MSTGWRRRWRANSPARSYEPRNLPPRRAAGPIAAREAVTTRTFVGEFVGTAMLLVAVVGSGIMGDRLSGGNVAIALLANAIATGAALIAIILTFGGISGAHLNPAVTLATAMERGLPWLEVPGYIGAQAIGAFSGVAAAHIMFELP